jgi:4-amino-4-deoxy-L-arabinose transferase-like glycosyltransferase
MKNLPVPTERQALFGSVLLGLWLCIAVPVFSQESYYWAYSQRPALSYFDHPPLGAWSIWLGTHVFGDGALGIRIGTLLYGLGVTFVGLALLRHWAGTAPARVAWIALGYGVPMYAVLHFLANPDPPLCLFGAAVLLCLWRTRDGAIGWWVLAGLAAGGALLSKYSAVFLAVGGVLVLLFDPKMRSQLRRPGPWLGVAVAVVIFLPVLLWNWQHEWASFRFQTVGRLEKAQLGVHWLGEFLGGQIGVLNPGIVLLLPFVLAWLWRQARQGDVRARWLLAFGVPPPVFCLVQAFRVQVKINWLLPAYLPLCIATVLWWTEGGGAAARPRLCAVAKWCLLVAIAIVPLTPVMRLIPQNRGSSWSGWDRIGAAALHWQQQIDAEDGKPGNVFFFGSDYKDSAQLQRALTVLGGGRLPAPVLAQNVFGKEALAYDYWEPPQAHVGEDAIYVLGRPGQRPEEIDKVKKRFRSVAVVQHIDIETFGIHLLDADIMVCRGYLGPPAK